MSVLSSARGGIRGVVRIAGFAGLVQESFEQQYWAACNSEALYLHLVGVLERQTVIALAHGSSMRQGLVAACSCFDQDAAAPISQT